MPTKSEPYFYWHKFHDSLFKGSAVKQMEARKQIIRSEKSDQEIPLRIKLFKYSPALTKLLRPMLKNQTYEVSEFYYSDLSPEQQTKVLKLHRKECRNCPWNGHTIFTRQRENGIWY